MVTVVSVRNIACFEMCYFIYRLNTLKSLNCESCCCLTKLNLAVHSSYEHYIKYYMNNRDILPSFLHNVENTTDVTLKTDLLTASSRLYRNTLSL